MASTTYSIRLVSSDIIIELDGETLYGHRFILTARSAKWDSSQLANISTLNLSGNNEHHVLSHD
jgi:hypothetical protein